MCSTINRSACPKTAPRRFAANVPAGTSHPLDDRLQREARRRRPRRCSFPTTQICSLRKKRKRRWRKKKKKKNKKKKKKKKKKNKKKKNKTKKRRMGSLSENAAGLPKAPGAELAVIGASALRSVRHGAAAQGARSRKIHPHDRAAFHGEPADRAGLCGLDESPLMMDLPVTSDESLDYIRRHEAEWKTLEGPAPVELSASPSALAAAASREARADVNDPAVSGRARPLPSRVLANARLGGKLAVRFSSSTFLFHARTNRVLLHRHVEHRLHQASRNDIGDDHRVALERLSSTARTPAPARCTPPSGCWTAPRDRRTISSAPF